MVAAVQDEFRIQRAERTQTRLRIALQGPSGGGKTETSLLLARGMVEELDRRGLLPEHLECHIGLLDTERDSAKLYSHLVPFDTVVLTPPYTVDRYLAALSALERVGYSVIIVDQITHEWHGEGGILSWVRQIQSQGGNEFTAWKKPSEAHDLFIDRLLATSAHLIATMRSKTEWVLEEVEKNGRTVKVPKRIGMAARQREGTEYEFTAVLDLDGKTNQARCLKDRTTLFEVGGMVPKDPSYLASERSHGMGPTYGARLIEWVYTADKPEPLGERQPTPEERCQAVADAGIRAIEAAPNVPDLQLAFDAGQKALRGLARDAGADVVRPELARLVAAKERRKAVFLPAEVVTEPGGTLSPDEVLVLEQLLAQAKMSTAAFQDVFKVPRLAMLPARLWDEAVSVVIARSGGAVVDVPVRPVAPARELSLPEQMEERVRKIGDGRGGLFSEGGDESSPPLGHPAHHSDPGGFREMKDDLPFE